jgi:hypothetical protein
MAAFKPKAEFVGLPSILTMAVREKGEDEMQPVRWLDRLSPQVTMKGIQSDFWEVCRWERKG